MNATQLQQWNDFSCMSRALIKADSVKNKKNPMTPDEFCILYDQYFPLAKTHYGGLILSRFFKIADLLGLGKDYDFLCHFDDVRDQRASGHLVFVFSGRHLDPARNDVFNHVSVLEAITDATFTPDGYPALPKTDWEAKRCSAIFMY